MLVLNSNHNADSRKSIFTKMTETWNSLPSTLCCIESQNAFKSNPKTHYFKLVYDTVIDIGYYCNIKQISIYGIGSNGSVL